jgi:adenine-specific DNA-methyltransferase
MNALVSVIITCLTQHCLFVFSRLKTQHLCVHIIKVARTSLEGQLTRIAWTILSDLHRSIPADSMHESRVLIDAIRLAALNQVAQCYSAKLLTAVDKDALIFSSLSYASDRVRVSRRKVIDLMNWLLDSSSTTATRDVRNLKVDQLVSLLGHIHAIGSYRLPLSLQQASSQHTLGAFYTPRAIVDYIVGATLGKKLRECARACRKHGSMALKHLLALRTIDPACGTGIFLISAFGEMQKSIKDALQILEKTGQSKKEVMEILQEEKMQLYGVDMDTGALEVANVSLQILEGNGLESLSDSHFGKSLKRGNSLISLEGFSGKANHRHFFNMPETRIPFEWQTEFPEVFGDETQGFDFVVMNPPYERLKPNHAEFIREQITSGEREIHLNGYSDYRLQLQENIRYFRESKEFSLATSYSLNTYLLFMERALQIAKAGATIGCIVPSNILSDISAQTLRRAMLLQNRLNQIDDFPEASRIFPGVTQSVSVIVLTKAGKTETFDVGLKNMRIEDARRNRKFNISVDRVHQVMGHSLVIPRIDEIGFELLELMHKQPLLAMMDWITLNRGELDLTFDKCYISHETSDTRLIRGSHIARYSLIEPNRAPEFVLKDQFVKSLSASGRSEHMMMKRIACQQISNMGQRWRLKFAPIDVNTVLSNSCNYLVTYLPHPSAALNLLLGVLNSELLNWRFQISNSNNHVSIRELQNLPLVPLNDIDQRVETSILEEVKKLKAGTINFSALLEATVFSLYGFEAKQARDVLHMRNCPEDESKKILGYVASF